MVNLRRIRLHATVHARARILIQRLLPYRLRKRLTRRRTTRRASLNLRIAETFNVTIDYLVIPGAPRRPLHAPGTILDARLASLTQLYDDERAVILSVIDAITTKAKLRLITTGAS
jgi:hypothetical protein